MNLDNFKVILRVVKLNRKAKYCYTPNKIFRSMTLSTYVNCIYAQMHITIGFVEHALFDGNIIRIIEEPFCCTEYCIFGLNSHYVSTT